MAHVSPAKRRLRRLRRENSLCYRTIDQLIKERDQARDLFNLIAKDMMAKQEKKDSGITIEKSPETLPPPEEPAKIPEGEELKEEWNAKDEHLEERFNLE